MFQIIILLYSLGWEVHVHTRLAKCLEACIGTLLTECTSVLSYFLKYHVKNNGSIRDDDVENDFSGFQGVKKNGDQTGTWLYFYSCVHW